MTRFYKKCGDCGGDIGEREKSSRADVCDTCWDNREWLLNNREMIGMEAFQEVQRSMRTHRGTVKRRIEKLKKEC